jgi:hypothetical protein
MKKKMKIGSVGITNKELLGDVVAFNMIGGLMK